MDRPELDGPTVLEEGHGVVATAVSGGDPGWRWVSSEGGRPEAVASYQPGRSNESRIRIKRRPGEYRIRFEIAPVRTAVAGMAIVDDWCSV